MSRPPRSPGMESLLRDLRYMLAIVPALAVAVIVALWATNHFDSLLGMVGL